MLSNKMLLLSAAAHDPTHPQESLNNALLSSEFTIRSVVTRDCGIPDNKCSGYIAISHKEKATVVAFRGSDQMGQVLTQFVEGLVVSKTPFWVVIETCRVTGREPLTICGSAWGQKWNLPTCLSHWYCPSARGSTYDWHICQSILQNMDGLVRIDWPFVRQFFKIKNRLKHTDTETALNFKLLLGEYMKLSVPATVSFLGSSGSLKSVKILSSSRSTFYFM